MICDSHNLMKTMGTLWIFRGRGRAALHGTTDQAEQQLLFSVQGVATTFLWTSSVKDYLAVKPCLIWPSRFAGEH